MVKQHLKGMLTGGVGASSVPGKTRLNRADALFSRSTFKNAFTVADVRKCFSRRYGALGSAKYEEAVGYADGASPRSRSRERGLETSQR